MKTNNFMEVKFKAQSVNESFARVCVASFCLPLNPTVDEINDIKTAVSEAITNCVVHAYPHGDGEVLVRVEFDGNDVVISVCDNGIGIKDLSARASLFILPNLMKSEVAWGLQLWKVLWMMCSYKRTEKKALKLCLEKH